MAIRSSSFERTPARGLMSSPLVTLHTSDTMTQAARTLVEHGISAAPVLDHTEKPVGVLSKTDVLRFQREYASPSLAEWRRTDETAALEAVVRRVAPTIEKEEDYVMHWMRPGIVAIAPGVSIAQAARMMAQRRIHRVFVREKGRLVGVLTAFDVLRAFTAPPPSPRGRRGSRRGSAAFGSRTRAR